MENRTELEAVRQNEVFYEAVIGKANKKSFKYVITKKTLEDLNDAVNIWIRDGKHILLSADKVERVMVRLVA